MQIQELAKKSREAIDYSDDTEAYRLISRWESFLRGADFQGMSPSSQEKVKNLILRLKIVAFPQLSDEKSAYLFENNLLDFFRLEVPLEAALTEKLFLYPYNVRREVREKLEKAMQNNKQLIGAFPIGAWIREFDKNFSKATRDSSAIVKFLNENVVARSLPSQEKQVLKKILHAYDYYLTYTLPDTGEGLEIIRKSFQKRTLAGMGSQESQPPLFFSTSKNLPQKTIEKKSLQEALKNMSGLGEQAITSFPIKLAQFDQPVRPSIKNWLHDYTSQLGQERHSSVERMRYLFSSENGKNLSSPDREKLAIILKSFDEDVPLPIDAGRQEVVFEITRTQDPEPRTSELKKELFIKPYPPVGRTAGAPHRVQPPVQGSTFPLSDKSSNSSRPNLSEIPQGRTLKPEPDRIIFSNPFPKPGTHEMPDSDIANIRFSEPSASQAYPKPKIPAPPQPVSREPAPYRFTRPPKNVIYPHLRTGLKGSAPQSKPEPKLDGNVVDLSGNDNDQ